MKYTAIISFLVVCTLAAVSANEDYEAAQISLGGPGRWGGFGYAPAQLNPANPPKTRGYAPAQLNPANPPKTRG